MTLEQFHATIANVTAGIHQVIIGQVLRRHSPANEVASVCWREWVTAHRRDITPGCATEVEGILRQAAGRPLEAAREIQALLGHACQPASPHTGMNARATSTSKGPL